MHLYSIEVRTVKSPTGSIRAARAATTRSRIEAAARTLFATRGYAATTLRDVAAEADVAVQTVYAVYTSKANIIRALIRQVIDDPAADAAFGEALAAATVDGCLESFSHSIRLRWEAGHDVVAILSDAGSADSAIRAEAEVALAARRRGIGELARRIAALDGRGPADMRRAAAIVDALTLPEIFAEFSAVHGWSADAYESWLAMTLTWSLNAGSSTGSAMFEPPHSLKGPR